jgi:asparagine synthase (glutamine-hydrolysing)
MCGFLGKISLDSFSDEDLFDANKRIICRGPDETKFLNQNNLDQGKVFFSFVFNRLSIIDLTDTASQPMISNNKENLMMFNGEIYNYKELKEILLRKGITFNSKNSDTEVLLEGLSVFGLDFINNIIGQFAIAFYEIKNKKIHLIRDRVGQKPLFFNLSDRSLVFGSNLISVADLSGYKQIDDKEIGNFFNYGVIKSPNTIYKNIYKLKPAEIITFNLEKNLQAQNHIYWSPTDEVDEKTFIDDEFYELFSSSINYRLESDVPVANFLSGGIDSSSIIKNLFDNKKNINTFSAIYSDNKYDESFWIESVKEKYKTNHFQEKLDLNFDFDTLLAVINIFDEPYCDPSIVPSFILSRLISKKYKVAISGDGGDELLGGYLRTSLTLDTPNKFEELYSKIYPFYPSFLGTGNHFLKNKNMISQRYASFFEDRKFMSMLGINEYSDFQNDIFVNLEDDYKSLLATDYQFYLPEMMMLKVDRTSMANSLEVRSPFVDHRLINYIMSHDTNYFDKNNQKALLKEYLSEDFNDDFINRKKMGFVFNIENFIFNNLNNIKNYMIENNQYIENSMNILNKLSKYKSRINAIRILKLIIFTEFTKA